MRSVRVTADFMQLAYDSRLFTIKHPMHTIVVHNKHERTFGSCFVQCSFPNASELIHFL
jgi:hypothetical protein